MLINNAIVTGSLVVTGNSVLSGSLNISGSITTTGNITAQTLIVQTVTSSVSFITGSTKFGSLSSNTHQFTGSVLISGSSTALNIGNGNVQIGTISSADSVTISKSTYPQIRLVETTTSPNATAILGFDSPTTEWRLRAVTNHALTFGTNDTERMRITSGGNVLLGTTSDNGSKLQVNGNTYSNAYRINDTGGGYVTLAMQNTERWSINYLGRFSGYGAGTLTTDSNGFIIVSSDRNLKDIIKPIENVLDRLMDFEPVYFKWNHKTDLDKENVYISTIAQSIEKGFPEAVGHMSDGTLTVQDRAVLAIAIRAIQELKAEIDELKNK